MFNQFRDEHSTVGGRKLNPTYKVKAYLESTVARELKKLAEDLSAGERQVRSLLNADSPTTHIHRTYDEWRRVLEQFESVEQEYRSYLRDDDLRIHDQILKGKRIQYEDLKDTVADYLAREERRPIGGNSHSHFDDETRRLERELKQISSRLERVQLSQSEHGSYSEDCSDFQAETVSDAFRPPLKRSTPRDPEDVTVGRQRHPLDNKGPECSWDAPRRTDADPTTAVLQKLAGLIENRREKLPQLEPDVFEGDLLQYPVWIRAFEMLIEKNTSIVSERLFYLGKYTAGEAKESISGFLSLFSQDAYSRAKAVLQTRYGDKVQVAQAYRQKLSSWRSIKKGDGHNLRKLADFMWQCNAAMDSIRNLRSLGSAEEMCNIVRILPSSLADRWDRVVDRHYYSKVEDPRYTLTDEEGEYPPFVELCKFLSQEARILNGPSRLLRGAESESSNNKQAQSSHKQRRVQALATSTQASTGDSKKAKKRDGEKKPPSCYYCEQPHVVSKCAEFLAKPAADKKAFASEQNLCFGCLSKSHGYAECRTKKPWLLKDAENESPESARVFNTHIAEDDEYYSMAVMVEVSHPTDPKKSYRTCALLDTQADGCFVSTALAQSLQLDLQPVKLELVTMGNRQLINSNVVSNLKVRGVNEDTTIEIKKLYTQEQIPSNANSLPRAEELQQWSHLRPIVDSLPHGREEVAVGLLIGNNCPALFVPHELAYNGDDQPYGVRTPIGWGVMGRRSGQSKSVTRALKTSVKELSMETVYRAFDMDFGGDEAHSEKVSQDDLQFNKIAERSLIQTDSGHFRMDLPMRDEPLIMPDNRNVALRQLMGQKRRFIRDPEYLKMYHSFMTDMIDQGHAEPVTEPGVPGRVNYTPQHGVTHPRKPGKLRVVSNFSSKKDGVSLNQKLLAGPDLTNNLVGVMCRFREERIAFMCDVKGMFFQVEVTPEHRDYLRFLWYADGDPEAQVVDYRMCVHPFGATSSPSCANYAFKENAQRLETEFGEEVTNFIKREFYVDDGLKSKRTPKEVAELFLKAHAVCLRGGFYLHKFTCNSAEALSMIPDELVAKNVRDYQLAGPGLPTETSLGVRWDMESDAFLFVVQEITRQLTRRGLLSQLCSIYDPMGLISPIILVGRIILQQLCTAGAAWDEEIPLEHRERWVNWYQSLQQLVELRIPRCYLEKVVTEIVDVQIHHFCDASTVGYGACSYLRLMDEEGNIDVKLICSKARVSPKKVTTMPRMELQAAVLAAKMAAFLSAEMPYPTASNHYWSDSQVVLGYIRNTSRRFHLYVTNRVTNIRLHSEVAGWRYVRSEENPADLASRGTEVSELIASKLWWTGPQFLQQPDWQLKTVDEPTCEITDDPEVKQDSVIVHNTKVREAEQFLNFFDRESVWERAVNHVFIWQQYLRKLQRHVARRSDEPEPENLSRTVRNQRAAESRLVMLLQNAFFVEEKKILSQHVEAADDRGQQIKVKAQLKKGSQLAALDPFLDEKQLIRIGGRLKRATLSRELMQPVVIPARHHLTQLLIAYHHSLAQHPGRQATLAQLRNAGFWILKGRSSVEKYTRDCVVCKRIRGTPIVQKMSDLPEERLQQVPAFTYCGMDLFGPFQVKYKRSMNKRWICVFICFNSLAVHLEVVEELSTDSFLNAFRRFVGRRGPVRTLFSDRGTNFVGAANTLKSSLQELDSQKVHRELLEQQCDLVEFRFNSPKSSHMGGLWERAIRTLRSVLSAILIQHSHRMSEESFRTFVVETESISNSKPLTCLDISDPTAEPPITPARLLTMKSGTALPPPGKFQEVDIYGYHRWRQVQSLACLFWKQWRQELLPTFQARRKWLEKNPSLKVGDVVILMDEAVPRGQWPLATVEEVIPSHDDLVRRVVIRCKGSKYERPACKLIYLGSQER